jgi:hypothetical protein
MQTQPSTTCPVYLHPAVLKDPEAINRVIADTGLAVVVGGNRAALSLVKKPARNPSNTQSEPNGFCQVLWALRDRALGAPASNPADDLGPWDGGSAA